MDAYKLPLEGFKIEVPEKGYRPFIKSYEGITGTIITVEITLRNVSDGTGKMRRAEQITIPVTMIPSVERMWEELNKMKKEFREFKG